jgi:hypothetical protein
MNYVIELDHCTKSIDSTDTKTSDTDIKLVQTKQQKHLK